VPRCIDAVNLKDLLHYIKANCPHWLHRQLLRIMDQQLRLLSWHWCEGRRTHSTGRCRTPNGSPPPGKPRQSSINGYATTIISGRTTPSACDRQSPGDNAGEPPTHWYWPRGL